MSSVIGVHGVARSGKDTVVNYLVENHGYTRVALADPVREAYYGQNPVVRVPQSQMAELGLEDNGLAEGFVGFDPVLEINFIEVQGIVNAIGWEAAKSIEDVRVGLQRMGTEAGRNIHGNDCWIKLAEKKIESLDKVAISDIRFENESALVRDKYQGVVLEVRRPRTTSVNDHISDKGLPSELVDVYIENDGTLEDLAAQVKVYAN